MAISAPFIALGSYAVSAYIEASSIASTAAQKLIADTVQKSLVKTMVSQFALKPLLYQVGKQVVIGTIKETIEEIVVDGFFETAIQSAVRMVGGPNDMGHWISTLFTSARESMNFASLTGIGTQSQQQTFAGQVQTAMGQDVEFLASVMDLKLQYEDDVSIAQVATANEQFLTAKMNEFGVLESSIQESKISVGRLLATGIFTGLAMLTPSLAGFNLYGASKLIGGIGGKIDAKIQNMFLAARNSKMLLKSAENLKKQEVDLGKKHVELQSEDIAPKNTLIVSKTPEIPSTLLESKPVEAAVVMGGGYSNFMTFLDVRDGTGRLLTHPGAIKSQMNSEISRAIILDNLEKVEVLKGRVEKIIEDLPSAEKSRLNYIIESFKNKKYDGIDIFADTGLIGGVNHRILELILEKPRNGESFSQLDREILEVSMIPIPLDTLTVYPASYDREAWKAAKVTNPTLQSDYYPNFVFFVDKILEVMYMSGAIIDQDIAILAAPAPDINILDQIIAPTSLDGLSIVRILDRLEKGSPSDQYYNPTESALDRIYVRLENFIMESDQISNKEDTLSSLGFVFNYYYRISGYECLNIYYRPTRLTITRIAEQLRLSGVIDNNRISDVDDLIEQYTSETSDLRELFRGGKKRLHWIPDSTILSEKVDLILTAVQNKMNTMSSSQVRIYGELETNIENIRDEYIEFLNLNEDGLGLLEEFPNSPGRVLISKIIKVLARTRIETVLPNNKLFDKILRDREPLKTLSNILFGTDDGLNTFLNSDSRKNPEDVLSIYLHFSYDTLKNLKDLGITITKSRLITLQKDIIKEIRAWFFSNPYDLLYINANPKRTLQPITQKELFPDYDFLSAAWLMSSIHKENPNLEFTGLESYGSDLFSIVLTKSQTLIDSSWRRIFNGMLDIYEIDKVAHPERLTIYRRCIKEAIKFANAMEYSLAKPTKPASHRHLFEKEYVIAYDAIMGLSTFHGIDPFTFDIIEDSQFSASIPQGADKFARHEPFGDTLDPFNQILTLNRLNSGQYQTLLLTQQRLGKELFTQLMTYQEFDAQGNLLDIDRTHIEKIYGRQNSWIYNQWYSNADFTKNLARLNHLRQEIRQKELSQYLADNWPVAHSRFWVNIIEDVEYQGGLILLINRLERLGDDALIRELLSLNLPEILRRTLSDHGFPTYP